MFFSILGGFELQLFNFFKFSLEYFLVLFQPEHSVFEYILALHKPALISLSKVFLFHFFTVKVI